MNKFVKELAEQCWGHRVEGRLIDGQLHFDCDKFAKLMIEKFESFIEESEGDIDYVKFLIDKNLKDE